LLLGICAFDWFLDADTLGTSTTYGASYGTSTLGTSFAEKLGTKKHKRDKKNGQKRTFFGYPAGFLERNNYIINNYGLKTASHIDVSMFTNFDADRRPITPGVTQ
jgi:hypothetical protein